MFIYQLFHTMKLKYLIYFLLVCCATRVFAQKQTKPVNKIFDSDMGPDYDDVGA
jgi:hypothetical protein